MPTVDELAIQCKILNISSHIRIVVKSKESLTETSNLLHAPVLKSKDGCAVIGGGASYEYGERT